MTSHLHDFLEYLDSGEFTALAMLEDGAAAARDEATKHAGQAVAFVMPEFDSVYPIDADVRLAKLPAPVVWCEGDLFVDGKGACRMGMLLRGDTCEAGGLQCLIFMRDTAANRLGWVYSGVWNLQGSQFSGTDGSNHLARWVVVFLNLLNCCNVQRVKHSPPPKLAKARAKRGRRPLIEFWTLELVQASGRAAELGGSHASPRLHLRRGHFRRLSDSRTTWVQPHWVGDRSEGVIHKDYDARQLAQ